MLDIKLWNPDVRIKQIEPRPSDRVNAKRSTINLYINSLYFHVGKECNSYAESRALCKSGIIFSLQYVRACLNSDS